MPWWYTVTIGCVIWMSAAATGAPAAPASFYHSGVAQSQALGVSGDGATVVGWADSSYVFRWTPGGVFQGITLPSGYFHGKGLGVSTDGTVIVGSASTTSTTEAIRLSNANGFASLGDLPGGSTYAEALGASGNGSVIVGYGTTASGQEAFRWTSGTGMVGLGQLPGYSGSVASAVSADGSTIIGGLSIPMSTMFRAFRWTAGTGMVRLGAADADRVEASALSADGSVIVGTAKNRAMRWSASGDLDLGSLPGFDTYVASGVSGDGSVIIGQASASGVSYDTFLWDPGHGMRKLTDVLLDLGVQVPSGFELRSPAGISADGTTIVGTGVNSAQQLEAFVAVVPEPAALPLLWVGCLRFAGRRRR